MRELPAALAAFAAYKQFILYKTVTSESRPGKTDKFPINYQTGKRHDAHDPAIWMSHEQAIQTAALWGSPFGVGFVFSESDPFWFLDIDDCLTPSGWAPHAVQICQLLAGCYIEVSQSGTGLHLFGVGRPPIHGCKNELLHIEFYHSRRFCALTGTTPTGDPSKDFTVVLPNLVSVYFPADSTSYAEIAWSDMAVPEWDGIEDDAELIRRAMGSKTVASMFGTKASFADLWLADVHGLGRAFPDNTRPYNESQADSSLAQHLAFWTGKNCERILRLMMQSKLYRDKYERNITILTGPQAGYLPRTILGVVARQIDVYKAREVELTQQSLPSATASPIAPASTLVTGNRMLAQTDQEQLFANMVYITDVHRVMVLGGHILKPDQFRVHFGGYTFIMDATNEKTSRDPWEAFTQSQLLRPATVNSTCFKPDLPNGTIVTRNGQTFVNTYVPIDVPRVMGDPSPFLRHLALVLPDKRDQIILMSFMAACVQYKGVKFQWAPLLQGVEGNGKTLFSRCVAEAIGERYVHFPPANEISEKFNSWLFGTIFIGVEDIYVPNQKQEVFEVLKPMITSDRMAKRAMQTDQVMSDVVCNFMFNSNHKDAIIKTANDRRICNLFSAQQEARHLHRDGMTGDYFSNLYKWLRADGYAIISEYLHTYAIPNELNPATECQRAPVTSTTSEALNASQGAIEQEILEAVAQGQQGFHCGWISSIYLDRLLERHGARRISHTKRREILKSLGYDYHPALVDGRVNNPVLPDAGKPRLYIHESSLYRQLSTPQEAARVYESTNQNQPQVHLPFPGHSHGGSRRA